MDHAEKRLALIEVLQHDGRPGRGVARAIDVHAWPMTLGRSLDNDVVIDDPHVAAEHARLEPDAQGRLVLTVLDSRNGALLGSQRLRAHQQANVPSGGAAIQLGTTLLRLRLPDEVLGAEQPLAEAQALPAQATSALLPALAGLALLSLAVAGHWLGLDPGADFAAWLPVLALPLALLGWCAVWALLSKLFQHHFDFIGHLRIALPWLLAIELIDALLPQLAAALAWPLLWRAVVPMQAILTALLVRSHLVHVLPLHRRVVTASVATAAMAGMAVSVSLAYRAGDSFSRAPYMSTLPLPALQWRSPVRSATLAAEMAPLADKLAERVRQARKDQEEESGFDEE
jgi:hypothetical protein